MSVRPILENIYHWTFIAVRTVEERHYLERECLIGHTDREDQTLAVAGLDVFSVFNPFMSIFRACCRVYSYSSGSFSSGSVFCTSSCYYLSSSSLGRHSQYFIVHSKALQLTIQRKIVFFMAYALNRAISQAVERLFTLMRPCELAQWVLFIFKACALMFISFMKREQQSLFIILYVDRELVVLRSPLSFDYDVLLSSRMRCFPHQTARARLASLPLGSIRPQSSCLTVYICPCWRSAEVPPIFDSYLPILTSSASMSRELVRQNYIVRMHVIILVREATSWLFLLLYETTILRVSSFSFVSHIMYDFAVILGGGTNGLAQFLFIYFMSDSFAFFSYYICL